MCMKKKGLSLLLLSCFGVIGGQSVWAADTACSIVTLDSYGYPNVAPVSSSTISPVPDTTIAVASNFYGPAQSLVGAFLQSTAGASYSAIAICHNATGHLMSEIMGLTSSTTMHSGTTYNAHAYLATEYLSNYVNFKYSLFLAANRNAPEDLAWSDGNSGTNYTVGYDALYANGIPALLLGSNQSSATVYDLVTSSASSTASGYYNGDTYLPTGNVALNYPGFASPVAIANPSAAPYGAAAQSILTAMGQWPGSVANMGSDTSSTCTASGAGSVPGVCKYDNVDVTASAIWISPTQTGIVEGFVSWAQILGLSGSPKYITFPSFAIQQWGVRLETDTTDGVSNPSETAAQALWNFMNLTSPGTYNADLAGSWNDWLASQGYGSI